jgi:Uma2 family endonuclease
MATAPVSEELYLGPECNGLRMTPQEFDAVEDYDENYAYELINGVVVVNPIAGAGETGPNELLGYYLVHYQMNHPNGSTLDGTLPQQYVRTAKSRRLADRLIWTGLGRIPNVRRDVAKVAVEFVSAGRRNARRDYVDKRIEYMEAGIAEYWIFDRFRRMLTVIRKGRKKDLVVPENETYTSPLLPGFKVLVAQILMAADRWARSAGGSPAREP